MKTGKPLSRRGFIKTTGGALLAFASQIPSPLSRGAEGSPGPVKRDPTQLKRLLDEMDAKGYQFWSVPRKDGEFLHLMVKATRARSVLELGTSHGYSAIWMGLGLEETDGLLTTLEIDEGRYDLARRHVAEAGLSQRVSLIKGDAHREITRIEGPFDFVSWMPTKRDTWTTSTNSTRRSFSRAESSRSTTPSARPVPWRIT